jgi:hypothetical protein
MLRESGISNIRVARLSMALTVIAGSSAVAHDDVLLLPDAHGSHPIG